MPLLILDGRPLKVEETREILFMKFQVPSVDPSLTEVYEK